MRPLLLLITIVMINGCFARGQSPRQFQFDERILPYVNAALKLSQENKPAEAVAEITKALAIEPQNAELFLHRAIYALPRDSRDPSFFKDLERALQLEPENDWLVVRATALLLRFGDVEMCRKVLPVTDALVMKHSENGDPYQARMRLHTCTGDLVGAYNDVAIMAEMRPGASMAGVKADLLSKMGDSKEAVRLFQAHISDLEKQLSEAKTGEERSKAKQLLALSLRARSEVHERNGDRQMMIADLTRGIDLVPSEAMYRARATAYQRMKKYSEAIADMSRALAVRPAKGIEAFYSDLHIVRSEIFVEAGKYDEAVADLEEALRLNPPRRAEIERRMRQISERKVQVRDPR